MPENPTIEAIDLTSLQQSEAAKTEEILRDSTEVKNKVPVNDKQEPEKTSVFKPISQKNSQLAVSHHTGDESPVLPNINEIFLRIKNAITIWLKNIPEEYQLNKKDFFLISSVVIASIIALSIFSIFYESEKTTSQGKKITVKKGKSSSLRPPDTVQHFERDTEKPMPAIQMERARKNKGMGGEKDVVITSRSPKQTAAEILLEIEQWNYESQSQSK